MPQRSAFAVLAVRIGVALLPSLMLGCGNGDTGHRVSGSVTFAGAPVPAGKIYFMPDGSKGNQGPTGFANIQGGKYDTAAGGKGSVAGPVVIMVEGVDPNAPPAKADTSGEVTAKLLFSGYELKAEMPAAASTKDIDVPAAAAKGPAQPKTAPMVVP